MADLKLQSIRKSYGGLEVLHGIDLDIRSGEFVVFVGPSGCGKSTLLRAIAGLEEVSSGTIEIGGRAANRLPPGERGIAMVFQSYALYPHMTVYKNMEFGLKISKMPKAERDIRVRKAAEILQLTPYLDRLPKALSGGQRQRVAIGRAITRDPKVFLFDEPLSNLDAALRVQTRIEIANLKEMMPATTMIYVTHDQVEAMTLADRIVVLNAGKIEQIGTPLELYHAPRTRFVAGFIGSPAMNFLPLGTSGAGRSLIKRRAVDEGSVNGTAPHEVGIRPEHLRRSPESEASLSGTVLVTEELGETTIVHLDVGGSTVVAKLPGETRLRRGDTLHLSFDEQDAHIFTADGLTIPTAPLQKSEGCESLPRLTRRISRARE